VVPGPPTGVVFRSNAHSFSDPIVYGKIPPLPSLSEGHPSNLTGNHNARMVAPLKQPIKTTSARISAGFLPDSVLGGVMVDEYASNLPSISLRLSDS